MTFSLSAHTSYGAYRLSVHPEVLHQVSEPEVRLCLWQRPSQMAIAREASLLRPGDLPDGRHATSRDTFNSDVCALFSGNGLDPGKFQHLIVDLNTLARQFFDLCGDQKVHFRLLTTDRDDCKRFHVDYRHLRLLCTYQGPGTEWLDDDQSDREAYERGAANEAIVRFGKPHRFETFWVGVLKDNAHPDCPGEGVIHRSPPILTTGRTRVLFCMDSI